LVHTGKGAKLKGQPLPADFPQGTLVHADLSAFADWLIAQPEPAARTHKAGAHA
jgi:D-glycero-D-manno-heptose 1,7-bisphosphate phosphatase